MRFLSMPGPQRQELRAMSFAWCPGARIRDAGLLVECSLLGCTHQLRTQNGY